MIASIVDTEALWTVVWASLVAGVGVTGAFGLALLGSIRALEFGRQGRVSEAALFGAVGLFGAAAVIAAIAFGIVVLAE